MSAPAIVGGRTPPPRTALRARPGAVPVGAILAACAIAVMGVATLVPLERLPFSLCMFKAVTGVPCLTCGATRALARLARLDIAGALVMNPLVAFGTLLLLPWAAADLILMPARRALALELSPASARLARIAFVVAVVLNWIWLVAAGR